MNFDLRTCDTAYYFVLEFMNMTPDEYLTELVIECENDFEKFWKRNIGRITEVNIEDLKIMAFHVVGALDECKEIKSNGLMNLQMVLSGNTSFNRLLNKAGITFQIKSKTLECDGMIYDIDYEKYRYSHFLSETDKKLSNIAHRVYYDFCINGFLANDDVLNYGTDIHERPEFLMTLAKLFPQASKLESYWRNKSKSYKVDFWVTVDQVHRFNFELDEDRDPPYEGWTELNDELKLKKWMLSHAIDRAVNGLGEQFLYVRDDVSIPPNQIVEVNLLDK
ncbi:hypothetical protein [Enterococcus cecorum]|uniref:hypothetical protein n=2 Tax=Enterococcus cecorum TaxID=44008 RepID=UPI00148B7CEB|nr:hypothetical protein [Enterococcus cecorum]